MIHFHRHTPPLCVVELGSAKREFIEVDAGTTHLIVSILNLSLVYSLHCGDGMLPVVKDMECYLCFRDFGYGMLPVFHGRLCCLYVLSQRHT